jgi:hypothetical protein
MKTMRAGVNFLRESRCAATNNHTSYIAFFHGPHRVKCLCLTSTSGRRLLAALQERKQLCVDLVL